MTGLLDTHTINWSVLYPERLSSKAKSFIEHPENEIIVSAISFYEMSVKFRLNKLQMKDLTPLDILNTCIQQGYHTHALNENEATSFFRLALRHHCDPFDRMLVWQSILSGWHLISKDPLLNEYKNEGLQILW